MQISIRSDRETFEHVNAAVKQKPLVSKKNNKSNNNKSSQKKRNTKKRYSYARCQELFKECPKKLEDVVVNNDRVYLEPTRQPPNAAEVRRLYEDLWGQIGP
jgi:hypothetical protein